MFSSLSSHHFKVGFTSETHDEGNLFNNGAFEGHFGKAWIQKKTWRAPSEKVVHVMLVEVELLTKVGQLLHYR
jgi:hypothetical protein